VTETYRPDGKPLGYVEGVCGGARGSDELATLGVVPRSGALLKADTAVDPANDTPGSSAWEQQDAANMRQISGLLTGLRDQLEAAAARESAEVGADAGDISDALDLHGACDLLDAVLGVTAAMVFKEQQEAADAAAAEGRTMLKSESLSPKSRIALRSARGKVRRTQEKLRGILRDDFDAARTMVKSENALSAGRNVPPGSYIHNVLRGDAQVGRIALEPLAKAEPISTEIPARVPWLLLKAES
jgi:hypothetical protein